MSASNTERNRPSDDELANFHLEIYQRARKLQEMRYGLSSDSNALRIATFEHFSKGMVAINNAIAHVKLFSGKTKEEQITAMLDNAQSTSPYYSKEAILIIENMLDKLSIEYQTQNNNRNSSHSVSTPTSLIGQSIGSSAVTVDQCESPSQIIIR
ncbi:MAG TPA: hypothetical protein VGE82_01200 [Nitrososphaera sp.]|jgi:hypothetical protein